MVGCCSTGAGRLSVPLSLAMSDTAESMPDGKESPAAGTESAPGGRVAMVAAKSLSDVSLRGRR